jgi:hypothetical protein
MSLLLSVIVVYYQEKFYLTSPARFAIICYQFGVIIADKYDIFNYSSIEFNHSVIYPNKIKIKGEAKCQKSMKN